MPIAIPEKRFSEHFYRQQTMDMPYSVAACCNIGVQENNYRSYSNNFITGYDRYSGGRLSSTDFQNELDIRHSCARYGEISSGSCLDTEEFIQDFQGNKVDPYSPLCMVPLPGHIMEPNFIRRRNERERERVRCVNEGYDKLKEHLPIENKDRRISKVETLRRAIDYIRELQDLLGEARTNHENFPNGCPNKTKIVPKLKKRRSFDADH